MYRTHTCGELRLADAGKTVTLAGWVQRVRELGHIVFVDLRDRYGITQLYINQGYQPDNPDDRKFPEKLKLGREFVIQAKGRVRERESKNANIDTGDIEGCIKPAEDQGILTGAKTPT